MVPRREAAGSPLPLSFEAAALPSPRTTKQPHPVASYTMTVRLKTLALLIPLAASAADWKPLLNGKNLDGWEVIGDGQWTLMADGTLLGQRIGDYRKMFVPGGPLPTPQEFKGWVDTQSWLYTTRNDFGEFDLELEYWTKTTGNSGVSLRDPTRAKWAIVTPPDYKRTPSKT